MGWIITKVEDGTIVYFTMKNGVVRFITYRPHAVRFARSKDADRMVEGLRGGAEFNKVIEYKLDARAAQIEGE